MHRSGLFVLIFFTFLSNFCLATVPEFIYSGLGNAGLTGIVGSDIFWFESRMYATSMEGFYRYSDGQWEAFIEVGVPGREVTAISPHPGNENRFITARLDEAGQSYLELTYINGQPNEVVHQLSSGRVIAIELDSHYANYEPWAISQAGDQPGDLLHSVDGGENWEKVYGHGMTDFSGIAIFANYQTRGQIYVAGDAGVARSLDGGISWEQYSVGLPPGPVRGLSYGYAPIGVPGKGKVGFGPLFAATDEGLYIMHSSDGWEQVLSEPCGKSTTGSRWTFGSETFALTQDGSLLYGIYDFNSGWDWEDCSGFWNTMEIVDVRIGDGVILLATAEDGIFQASAFTPSDVPDASQQLNLSVAPNPFNPRTTISYELPHDSNVTLQIFDLAGRKVWESTSSGSVPAGRHELIWEGTDSVGRDLPSGTYLLRMDAEGYQAAKGMALVR